MIRNCSTKSLAKTMNCLLRRFSLINDNGFDKNQYEFVNKLEFRTSHPKFSLFQIIGLDGKPFGNEYEEFFTKEKLLKIYETMLMVEEMDGIMLKAQRQGRFSFYMTSYGELGCIIGSIAGLEFEDLVFPQYRELGACIYRGMTPRFVIDQCVGNKNDLGSGHQMPIHVGSAKLNLSTVSSTLGTQVPNASGAGYGFRIKGENRISATYFGEGAASEGDVHAAMNFAATLRCQTLFFCRNNKYAISTPESDQYVGDGIATRGSSYGIASLKVDGNDTLACVYASAMARKYILENKKPALIEFMTYRKGDHSTSDNSSLYRNEEEVKTWELNDPVLRLAKYLDYRGWKKFDPEEDKQTRKKNRDHVLNNLKMAESIALPAIETLFEEVYDKMTPNLHDQMADLHEHLDEFGHLYACYQRAERR